MKRAMALATRVGCNEESDGFGGKSNGNEGDRQLTATRVMATVMMVAGDEEGMVTAARAMATATMVAGKQWRWHRRG
jgi:hypothetical protein